MTLACAPAARAAEVDLRVLVVAVGDINADPGRMVAEQMLDKLGVPYEVLDTSRANLTTTLLRSGSRGRFNGIILTQSETLLPNGSTGFDAAEFAMLHTYERDYGVREAVLSGFPATNPTLGIDYGMAGIAWGNNVEGAWVGPAGGTEIFEYVNTANRLPTEGFTFLATPRNDPAGPVPVPLLVNADDPAYGMIFRIDYPNGRKVLFSAINNAWFFLHTSVIGYEFLNFATSGLFIGARKVYLSLHNDDLFLPDEVWNPATLSNYPEDVLNFRLTAAEVPAIVTKQQQFRAAHPLAANIITEVAFNGIGASTSDPLTQAFRANGAHFGFINHTYSALQMDRLCPEDGEPSGGGDGGLFDWFFGWLTGGSSGGTVNGCPRTDYTTAYNEISRNQTVWRNMGFPGYTDGRTVLLADSHSGLSDRRGTEDTADDIPFPEGFNSNFGNAATSLGVRVLAADASRQNQNRIQRVPGHNLVILPRYPTSLFYNTTTPAELESEYNYIFHYRFIEEGIDPCTVPGAICAPRTYEQILQAEATTTLRHMLASDPFPHYFHQTNLHVYDQAGRILQFDWMESVVSAYEKLMKLPIESPRFHQLGALAIRTVEAREARVTGYYDNVRRTITLSARANATIDVTGISGGALYGGQRIGQVAVNWLLPRTVNVDLALTQ